MPYSYDRNDSIFTSPGRLWQEGTVIGPVRPSLGLGRAGRKLRSIVDRTRRSSSSSSSSR